MGDTDNFWCKQGQMDFDGGFCGVNSLLCCLLFQLFPVQTITTCILGLSRCSFALDCILLYSFNNSTIEIEVDPIENIY